MIITSNGIVLKQKKIANNRRIITIFTREYGKISAGTSLNEKGKNKSALALRPFTFAEYELFKSRNSYNINSTQVKKSFYSIGENLDRFDIASKLIEYLDAILEEGQKRTYLFDLSIKFFESISKINRNYDTLWFAFLVKTFKFQGIMPELNNCVGCGDNIDNKRYMEKKYKFSVRDGGFLCENCLKNEEMCINKLLFNLDFDIINTLNYFINTPLQKFEKVELKKDNVVLLRNILSEYCSYYLGCDFIKNEWR